MNATICRKRRKLYTVFGNNNSSDMWVTIKKLTDHKKYNTIPDDIFYGNNIFGKCERKMYSISFIVQ